MDPQWSMVDWPGKVNPSVGVACCLHCIPEDTLGIPYRYPTRDREGRTTTRGAGWRAPEGGSRREGAGGREPEGVHPQFMLASLRREWSRCRIALIRTQAIRARPNGGGGVVD